MDTPTSSPNPKQLRLGQGMQGAVPPLFLLHGCACQKEGSLKWQHIDLESGRLLYLVQKGRKDRLCISSGRQHSDPEDL